MKKPTRIISFFLTLAIFFAGMPNPALAQNSPRNSSSGLWQNSETYQQTGSSSPISLGIDSPLTVGGPDEYGYTWNDTVPLSWIDATNGIKTTLTATNEAETVALPFSFEFYENSYSNLYITAYGYVAFEESNYWDPTPYIPFSSTPNNIIAPYATNLYLAYSADSTNKVYYTSGGTAPNRYFVVEWHQVTNYLHDENLTFEVILHENGDIVFQYLNMTYGDNSANFGIEDSTGLDGLAYSTGSNKIPSNTAVRFIRPTSSGRMKVNPVDMGVFTRSDQKEDFSFTILNIGDFSDDTFELSVTSDWPASGFNTKSGELLTDTDMDGRIDTGRVARKASFTVGLQIQTPFLANIGDHNSVTITITSARDSTKSKTVRIQMAVPAPFVQSYSSDRYKKMSVDFVQPSSFGVKEYTENFQMGDSPSITETSQGFIYLWNKFYSTGYYDYYDLEFNILDQNGNVVRPTEKLTSNNDPELYTVESDPAAAVTSDGHIGIVWARSVYDRDSYTNLCNIYFAVLDSSGDIILNPTNLTNNTTWGSYSGLNVPYFDFPRITATGDNRFTIVWHQRHNETGGEVSDIYYAVNDSNGNPVKPITQLTQDTADSSNGNDDPASTALTGNRIALVWAQIKDNSRNIVLSVLDSNGIPSGDPIVLGLNDWYNFDLVQLTTGNILIAGNTNGTLPKIVYSILDGNDYSFITGSTSLTNPFSVKGDAYVSVTADLDGHNILTWMDADQDLQRNLFYALIHDDGSVITPPMLFLPDQQNYPQITTSFIGYGNTSYTLIKPTSSDVDLHISVPSSSTGAPGTIIKTSLSVQNIGLGQAESIVLTATLDPALSFVSANFYPTSIEGNMLTWNLPVLDFLGGGGIALFLKLPAASTGSVYPINWAITSSGIEANPSDNTGLTQVLIGEGVYLPLVLR